jgi:hypothetical protein
MVFMIHYQWTTTTLLRERLRVATPVRRRASAAAGLSYFIDLRNWLTALEVVGLETLAHLRRDHRDRRLPPSVCDLSDLD